MKYIKGCMLIILLSFTGEMCRYYIPLHIPGSIYGLLLLVLLLWTKVIKTDDIEKVAAFLFVVFPIIFIPSATKIVEILPQIKEKILKLLFIILVSTVCTMVITAFVTDKMISIENKKREK